MIEDNEFLSFYKKRMEDFKPVPPMESWEEIERQLDIDDVWQNIHSDLEQVDKGNRISTLSKISELGVIIAIFFWFLSLDNPHFNSSNEPVLTAVENESFIDSKVISSAEKLGQQSPTDISIEERDEKQNGFEKEPLEEHTDKKGLRSNLAFDRKRNSRLLMHRNSEVSDSEKSVVSNTDTKNPGADNLEISKSLLNREIASLSGGDPANLPYKDLKFLQPLRNNFLVLKAFVNGEIKPVSVVTPIENTANQAEDDNDGREFVAYRPGFSFGINGALKNHWLLNNTTYRGLSSDELTTTLPSFGTNIGILMAYDISPRTVLQAEFTYSEEGQSYKDYINGRYQKTTSALAYYNVSAIAKYRLHPLFAMSNAMSSNVILGFYFGRLQKAEEILENNTIDLSHEYKNFDTGLFIGYEYEYRLFKSLIIAPGVRFRYGLTNIYEGDGSFPGSMNVTKNGSLDLNISLKYNFSSK